MSDSSVAASCATYRKVVDGIAKAIKTVPHHTKYPSEDFREMIDEIPEAMREKALQWYERGIKRGMSKATDLMAKGEIYREGNIVHAPKSIKVQTKIKVSGGAWEKYSVTVKAKDIGFK
ncbi:hypothetical protein PSH55_09355 [Pseudoalteromonas sp. Angola-31]|nr:hypothetical protein [Pseudoalteromonas sp. Angola-31]